MGKHFHKLHMTRHKDFVEDKVKTEKNTLREGVTKKDARTGCPSCQVIDTISTLPANQSDPRVTILHLKERFKKLDINRVIDTKGKDQNKVYRHCILM